MSIGKYAGLVFAILIGLVLGQMFGPVNSLPTIARVDERYLEIIRNHTLFLGLTGSLAACVANLMLRISHVRVLVTLTFVAAIWFVWFQSADPGFLAYLAGALAEFLFWILISAAPVVAIFWFIESRVLSSRNAGKADDA